MSEMSLAEIHVLAEEPELGDAALEQLAGGCPIDSVSTLVVLCLPTGVDAF